MRVWGVAGNLFEYYLEALHAGEVEGIVEIYYLLQLKGMPGGRFMSGWNAILSQIYSPINLTNISKKNWILGSCFKISSAKSQYLILRYPPRRTLKGSPAGGDPWKVL